VQLCPNCGEENPPRFRLCGFCGTPLAAVAPPTEIRKTVSVVFADLQGSTALGEALDSESLREVLSRYFEAMKVELERHGGTVEKYIGDAVMAVFGLPTVHEDDALRAVRAADAMRVALARLNEELERAYGVRLANRTGVNTGEVVAGDAATGQRLVTGDPVNTAARLEQAAPTGEILLGDLTYKLVRDVVEVEPVAPLALKGKAELTPAYRLLAIRKSAEPAGRDATPMVGRAREMRMLRVAFDDAVSSKAPRMVTIIGDAGVGKSRLVREFVASLPSDTLTLAGRCLPYGQGITFWPFVEIVRRAADIDEDDAPERARAKVLGLIGDEAVADRIAAATGLSAEPFPLTELFDGIRRFVRSLAERGPVMLLVDDIHWAEPTLLDLLEHVTSDEASSTTFILCTARHDLLESRPDWGDGGRSGRLELGPLGEAESTAIVESILGQSGLPAAVRDRVVVASEGNPLFVEQLVSMLIDDGVLRRVEGDWRVADEVGEVGIPPTIQALLAARLDRLRHEERAVVEPASVVGLVFQEAAIRSLVPEAVAADVPVHLATLDRKQLVHPATGAVEGDSSHRFHHILIRDAAYNGQLKRARATLHERFADWADAVNADRDRALEFEEILGYHLEQAYRYLGELGPLDDHGIELGVRASGRLASAGRRAVGRGDLPAAANLLRRAAAALAKASPQRSQLLIEAGEAMTQVGDLTGADAAFDAAISDARAIDDRPLEVSARVGRLYLHYITEGDADEARVIEQVEEAIRVLEPAAAHSGLSRAWRILTNVHFAACRYLDAQVAAEQMIEEAQLAGDRPATIRVLPALAVCAQLGPTPVPEAIGIVERILADVRGDRQAEALTIRALANLEAMRGRFSEARTLYRRSRATLDELGVGLEAALTSATASGPVELIADDAEAAESELRRDYEALAAMGERNYISTTAALLAEALYRQDRDTEAMELTLESERIGAADDVVTQFLWRSIRAKVLARMGRQGEAMRLSSEAVAIIGLAQDPDSQGYAAIDQAEVLRMVGRTDDAAREAGRAVQLFALKGNTASGSRAQATLGEIEGERAVRSIHR
jgi:class 3 adenylate cyclase/tetratricopeptide (TPR) repeat protein